MNSCLFDESLTVNRMETKHLIICIAVLLGFYTLGIISNCNFATTQTLINKNNLCIFKSLKPAVSWFRKCKFDTPFPQCNVFKMSNSLIQLPLQIFINICRISPILKTLVLLSLFPFCCIFEVFYHNLFYITSYRVVTLQCSL